jgi:uridine kinase
VSARTFADLATLILDRPPRLGPVRLVGVDGPSGAGKTRFAVRLAAHLGAPVVHADDLVDGWDDQPTFWPRVEESVLAPLRDGRSPSYRRYQWDEGRFGGAVVTVVPAPAVLLEGFGSTREAVRPELTLAAFVTAPADLRRRRVIARDGRHDVAFRAYLERWHHVEAEHFAADDTAARADLVVDGAVETPDDRYRELRRSGLTSENG